MTTAALLWILIPAPAGDVVEDEHQDAVLLVENPQAERPPEELRVGLAIRSLSVN